MGKHFNSDTSLQKSSSAFQRSAEGNQATVPAGKSAKDRRKRRSRIISNILTALGVVLLLVAAGIWGYNQFQYMNQDQQMEQLAAYAEVGDNSSKPPKVDWEGLKKVNKDAVAWIQMPGTIVNYPVYQGATNDTYLRTLADGSYGVGGLIFLDSDNKKPGLIDQQSIVYGHHLKNGAMFKRVADMDKQELFDSIKTIWYVTEDKAYELEPLFLYYTHPDDTTVCIYNFANDDAFHDYLRERLAKAVTKQQNAAQKIDKVKHVLTLSTCNYIDGYGRTELVCAIKSEVDA